MPRPIEHHYDHVLHPFFQGAGYDGERFGNRGFQLQGIAALLRVLNHARPVRQLHHVKGRHIAQRHFHAFLGTCRCDATDRIRCAFGNVRRAVDRINRDVELRRARQPGAELFAFENSRRFILDSLADHNFAANVHEIEHAAHGVAGRRIRCLLVAAS